MDLKILIFIAFFGIFNLCINTAQANVCSLDLEDAYFVKTSLRAGLIKLEFCKYADSEMSKEPVYRFPKEKECQPIAEVPYEEFLANRDQANWSAVELHGIRLVTIGLILKAPFVGWIKGILMGLGVSALLSVHEPNERIYESARMFSMIERSLDKNSLRSFHGCYYSDQSSYKVGRFFRGWVEMRARALNETKAQESAQANSKRASPDIRAEVAR